MPAPFGRENDNQDADTGRASSPATGRNTEGNQRSGDPERPDRAEAQAELVPTPSLPKGGGAIGGLGEKFSVAAPTGTGGMSIPIATSPSRGGLGPGLGLSYDSGAGNGPFGLGWRLSPPSISRKTNRGVPRYLDGTESDTFVLVGAEDLVPMLEEEGEGWSRVERVAPDEFGDDHRILTYRPRVEGGFARIERWVRLSDRRTHWRVIDRENVTSFFGRTESRNGRVFDPDNPARVFQWLLDEVRDDRGNVTIYEYKSEDLEGVSTTVPWEAERSSAQAQRYLSRIAYGNRVMGAIDDFMFEVRFDYGEYGPVPARDEASTETIVVPSVESGPWSTRLDTFSSHRSGFDIRTRRLCRRVLMFHRFPNELGSAAPVLVASTDFYYEEDPAATLLVAATQRGYVRTNEGEYRAAAMPPVELEYSRPTLGQAVRDVDPSTIADLGRGVDGAQIRLTDLDAEGLPGILVNSGRGLQYKEPLMRSAEGAGGPRYGRIRTLPTIPSTGTSAARLMDLDGDGRLSLVDFAGPRIYPREDEHWAPPRPLTHFPGRQIDGPRVQWADVDGDGLTDILVDNGDHFAWYRSKGHQGFEPAVVVAKPHDDAQGPQLVYGSPQVAIFVADMTGDGLADIVRVRAGDLAYWPNLGHGRFGTRIRMGGLSAIDHPESFRADAVRLGDIDGSGTADLLYFGRRGPEVRLNQSGNRFAEPQVLGQFPPTSSVSHADLVDLTGTGTADLVWSSPLPRDRRRALRYIDLMPEGKPYLLTATYNNRGLETRVRYAPSTRFYLEDKAAGRPWRTRLPFPVQVIERVEVLDRVRRARFVSTYRYRHGYFDGPEREFRGFGFVEQRDAEAFEHHEQAQLFPDGYESVDDELRKPPVVSRSWFHTGAFLGRAEISQQFVSEYWSGDPDAAALGDTTIPEGVSPAETREALRVLRGSTLRQEIYVEDGSSLEANPYQVTESNTVVRLVQPKAENAHAVFVAHAGESIASHYERGDEDSETGVVGFDPRVSHSLVLRVDEYAHVTRAATVAYPRRTVPAEVPEQGQTAVVITETDVVNAPWGAGHHRLGTPFATRAFELGEMSGDDRQPFSVTQLDAAFEAATVVEFEAVAAAGQRRRLSESRQLYYDDALVGPLPLGQVGIRALPFETREQVMTDAQRQAVFGADVDASVMLEGGYVQEGSAWFVRSGRQIFDPTRFYLPTTVLDAFGNATTVEYDPHTVAVLSVADPLLNTIEAQTDYRTLSPDLVTDPNGNRQAVAFDELGLVVATAVMGKTTESLGDTLEDPTARMEYDLWAYYQTRDDAESTPVFVHSYAREQHGPSNVRWIESRSHHDGGGQVVQVKAQAEPGLAPLRDEQGELVLDAEGNLQLAAAASRWVGNGRTVLDNKGNPVKQYEPFFSDRPDYESEAVMTMQGVTPTMHYDPLGRLIRTQMPDGTFSRVDFDPWRQVSFDPNDTAVESSWHTERLALPAGDSERRAAEVTVPHHDTPTVAYFDSLGRTPRVLVHNRRAGGSDEFQLTRTVMDVEGNVLQVIDARGNEAEARVFGMQGLALQVSSHDAGIRRTVPNVLGAPLRAFDDRGHAFRNEYDALFRPTHAYVQAGAQPEQLLVRTFYGESVPNPEDDNLRGQVLRHFDSAGVTRGAEFDFKGQLLRSERRLATSYTSTPDWTALAGLGDLAALDAAAEALLETEVFVSETTWDALGRPETQTSADGTVTRLTYNDAGQLESVAADVRGAVPATSFVDGIDYDVRGRRSSIAYGNGTTTTYAYDDTTLRLRRIHTTRASDGATLQDLRYVYDPVGNIVEIDDLSQQTVFFANAEITARQRFEYDATYQLTVAEGREHATQGQPVSSELTPGVLPDTNDPAALRPYSETYLYDPVGNIEQMQHVATGGNWTRAYQYDASGNRLLSTSAPSDPPAGPFTHTYAYDVHGNMTAMPHLAAIDWDYADRMQHADLGGGGDVWFVYDSSGNRVRKVRVNQAGSQSEERVYLGGVELYRERQGSVVQLERETLHISDDTGRICLVETQTVDAGAPVPDPANIARYQYSNHLGSASLELDDAANTVSYEEYHPYGSSSYRAVDSSVEVSAKRYRYTGKERDEETGLYYHGARYYACWLGRWTASDPIGLGDGVNRYAYVRGNPVALSDPTGTSSEAEHAAILQAIAANERAAETAQGAELEQLQRDHNELVDRFNALTPSEPTDAEKRAARKALRRRERQRNRLANIRKDQVNYLAVEFEENLRAADAEFLERYAEAREASLTGAYFLGRDASIFEPGGDGPRRIAEYQSRLYRIAEQYEGLPQEDFNKALEKVRGEFNRGLVAGIAADRAAEVESIAFVAPGLAPSRSRFAAKREHSRRRSGKIPGQRAEDGRVLGEGVGADLSMEQRTLGRIADDLVDKGILIQEEVGSLKIVKFEGPKKLANPDPALGGSSSAQRFQVTVENAFGEIFEFSVNFDPVNRIFGTVKPASGKP